MTQSKTPSKPALKLEEQPSLPWGPVSAIAVTLGIYFTSQIVGSLLILLYPAGLGWSQQRTSNWLEGSVVAQFLTVLIIESLALLLLWWFLKRRRAKPAQLGLVKPEWRDVGMALAGFGCYFLVNAVSLILIGMLTSIDTNQQQELGFSTTTTGSGLMLIFISLVILPPIVEEILFRGFLYTGLASRLRKLTAALVTSVLFAVAHLQFGSGNALLWAAAVDTFILSMVLVYLREKTGSLWSPIGVHFLKNGLAFLVLFVFRV